MKTKIEKLYEDENIVVINKPAGMNVHADGKVKEIQPETIADWVLENYPKTKGVGENIRTEQNISETGEMAEIEKPGIVHRLDKETSGCLIICKNENAYKNFKEQFQEHTVQKEYIAICAGWLKYETGIINKALARSKNDFRKKDVVTENHNTRGEEREALTRYKLLKRFEVEVGGKVFKLSMVNFYPKTGRMHQIRVHAKSLGHPVLGDKLYGSKAFEPSFRKIVTRHLLHAKSIEFDNLETLKRQKVESVLPADFEVVLQNSLIAK
jgi:23S rRNA pseudouridine1911/1915/1917 synthase